MALDSAPTAPTTPVAPTAPTTAPSSHPAVPPAAPAPAAPTTIQSAGDALRAMGDSWGPDAPWKRQPRDEVGRFAEMGATDGSEDDTSDAAGALEGDAALLFDGTVADGETPAEGDATPPVDGEDAAAPDDAATDGDGAPEPIVVKVPGPRGDGTEDEVELEITDPEAARRLQFHINNGMRREEFNAQKATLDEQRAELDAYHLALQNVPDLLLVEQVKPEVRLSIARQLLAEHFDELAPEIQKWWGDEVELKSSRLTFREQRLTQKREVERINAEQKRGVQIQRAVESLIPDGVSQEDANAFLVDAFRDLSDVARTRDLAPDAVPELLARRVRQYGFTGTPSAAAAPSGAPSAERPGALPPAPPAPLAVAAPKGDDAQQLAEKRQRAQTNVRRQKAAAAARAAAAAVAPAGAGARTVQRGVTTPMPKFGSIEEASAWVRQHGNAGAPR